MLYKYNERNCIETLKIKTKISQLQKLPLYIILKVCYTEGLRQKLMLTCSEKECLSTPFIINPLFGILSARQTHYDQVHRHCALKYARGRANACTSLLINSQYPRQHSAAFECAHYTILTRYFENSKRQITRRI